MAQVAKPVSRALFTNVNFFDGVITKRIENASVLLEEARTRYRLQLYLTQVGSS